MDSIFSLKGLAIRCPDYSCLSKRLSTLNIPSPLYTKEEQSTADDNLAALAIDSTGLKRFGRDEWHQEKHKISANRSWRKLHIAVDDHHIIHAALLTDRFVSDDSVIDDLLTQIEIDADKVTADGAYDKNPVYHKLSDKFKQAAIIIPPDSDAVYHKKAHPQRNRILQEIKTFGRMVWQKVRGYGQRNHSELAVQRYKRMLGNRLHASEFSRQQQEAMIGTGCLNKMTRTLGMPESYSIN